MNEHDVFQKAFSNLQASDDTLRRVMDRAHGGKCSKITPKRVAVLVAVVVVLFSMALVVHGSIFLGLADRVAVLTPAKDPDQVIDDAFGNHIDPQNPEMYDYYGNPIETPNTERVDADLTKTRQWIGDYISDVDAVASLGESKFTLKSFLIDETGAGVLIWSVENPNGLHYIANGYGPMCFEDTNPFCEVLIKHFGVDGQQKTSVCSFNALISEKEDGSALEIVTYFGTFDRYEIGDHFVWSVEARSYTESAAIQITPVNHIPVKTMTAADGTQLTIANHNLAVDVNCNDDFQTIKTVIHFKDGTQYCLEDVGKDIYNISGGFWRSYEAYASDDLVLLFNRLIDTNAVASVEMTAEVYRTELVGEEPKTVVERKAYVFYP